MARLDLDAGTLWVQAESGERLFALPQLPDFARAILAAGGITQYVRQYGRFPGEA